jgi:hypothetical protein
MADTMTVPGIIRKGYRYRRRDGGYMTSTGKVQMMTFLESLPTNGVVHTVCSPVTPAGIASGPLPAHAPVLLATMFAPPAKPVPFSHAKSVGNAMGLLVGDPAE